MEELSTGMQNAQKERYALEILNERENALRLLSIAKAAEKVKLDSGLYEYIDLKDDFNTKKLVRKKSQPQQNEGSI